MANKTLFKSLIGKLMPTTDALNEERAPAYALPPKHKLAQYATTGLKERAETVEVLRQRLATVGRKKERTADQFFTEFFAKNNIPAED